jgi:glycosyltransferase involved in cell wall biosynthesis
VIATNIGAIPEMLDAGNKQAGICINLEDGLVTVESISLALEQYLLDATLVEQHSVLALKAAEKFTMSQCVRHYLDVFDNKSS